MNRYLLVLLFARLSLSPAHAQEQRILTSDSVALYVQVKGEGPACLFIHGGPGSAATGWRNSSAPGWRSASA